MTDSLHELLYDSIRKFNEKKDKLIIDRITELGYSHLLETKVGGLFPNIIREVHPTKESIWIDNDTEERIHVVTFIKTEEPEFKTNEEFKLTISENYYF